MTKLTAYKLFRKYHTPAGALELARRCSKLLNEIWNNINPADQEWILQSGKPDYAKLHSMVKPHRRYENQRGRFGLFLN